MDREPTEIEHPVHDDPSDHHELDYSRAKPNRFAKQLAQDRLMVVLDSDMAALFPTSEAGSEAAKQSKHSIS